MKSEGMQLDFVDRMALIRAHRIAADYALHSPFHTEQERQERAEHYRGEADRLEAAL